MKNKIIFLGIFTFFGFLIENIAAKSKCRGKSCSKKFSDNKSKNCCKQNINEKKICCENKRKNCKNY